MQIYKGVTGLSDFRKKKLLERLRKIDKSIRSINAEFVHFVNVRGNISGEDDARLSELLTYGSPFKGARHGKLFVVTPRPGTISPWSSKATDIAKNSGLGAVKRIERGIIYYVQSSGTFDHLSVAEVLHDRMTESVLKSIENADILFADPAPRQLTTANILKDGKSALTLANQEMGLALSDDEVEYLYKAYKSLKRDPTDVELMMFAQVNSEHCRHKIFNADWVVEGDKQPKSLFGMIKNTYEKNSKCILSAYSDNAAVLEGKPGGRFFADPGNSIYAYHKEPIHSVIKVETHNHPTGISPFPGAATGVGGEIRDEGATGRGAKAKMGLAGYSVSNLNIPGAAQPWEKPYGKPDRLASALDIMVESPVGAASFANEYGRPNLAGYFRTYEYLAEGTVWGYHKPIMLAGGLGNIRDNHVQKQKLRAGDKIIVLGGPAMLIGLGGGSASSMNTGASDEDLDFASVQRSNAEIERRAQEVIDSCWALGDSNPIITIHDVGAGGLSNALPELVHDSSLGASFELRDIPSVDTGLSPLEIWCNEAQERYVLGVTKQDLVLFEKICERERCPFAVVGEATSDKQLIVNDRLYSNQPVNLPMATLFGKTPKMTRKISLSHTAAMPFKLDGIEIAEAVERVLRLPSVGSKKFLITIGDRSVGGLVSRDQMIGPWQVPVSDVAVTAAAFNVDWGEAMAIGERTPLALINAPASARMAVGEAITNIAAADIEKISDIKLSANWMAAAGFDSEDQKLFETVRALGEEFCPALGLTIPVGKDSLSMRSVWQENDMQKSVTSPLSVIISAFSSVSDVSKTLTPQLDVSRETSLILVDIGQANYRLGGSALAQVYNQLGGKSPDVSPSKIKEFFLVLRKLKLDNVVLAYHDRSDGGLLATFCEMAFASRCGLDINLAKLPGSSIEKLFNEELGVIIQVRKSDEAKTLTVLRESLGEHVYAIGRPTQDQTVCIKDGRQVVYQNSRTQLESWWASTSHKIQRLRDNPDCADQEFRRISDDSDPGILPAVNFKLITNKYTKRPKVAILREQGVNGHIEMAAAFDKVGFASVDVHLSDIIANRVSLDDFAGLVACGGFSYGDVLGAGQGWAKSVIFHEGLKSKFRTFFERQDTFSLGVCNGCQVLAALKELVPGAESWPKFIKNSSEQFEARLVLAKVNESPSIFFRGMAGSYLPVPVAHGEGRAYFANDKQLQLALAHNQVPLQYVDNDHQPTENYPFNPNGSPSGITALTTPDGRATIMMPHPERAFMTRQLSWHPKVWGADSPWLRIFQNAREWMR